MNEILLLLQSGSLSHLDLLSVGIVIAAIALLGFVVYLSNPKSISHIFFVFFCAVTMVWSFVNYISYQTTSPELTLYLWRFVIFLGVWHSFTFFSFLYFFPKEKAKIPKWYMYILLPTVLILSVWILFGNLVFSGVAVGGVSPQPVVEPGIIIFLITVVILIVSAFVSLITKIVHAKKHEKAPFKIICTGAIFTFILLFTCNLILPAVFEILRFIPLGAVTMFPFCVFTVYAMYRHKAFKVKHLASPLMAFMVCVVTFIEIIFAESKGQLILRLGVFFFVLLICIQFIKNIFVLEETSQHLEDANGKLKLLDKLKSEFISLASHQLRSPLTVIKGYASTLSDGVVGELTKEQKEIVRHIFTSAQGLASLVEDFLNVTKIEQGGMKYVFEETNIKAIVEDLSSDMSIVAEDKGLSFSLTIDPKGVYTISGDMVKLKQVFLNIIDNAIKYTEKGSIALSLASQKETIIFSITDTGAGISEETKEKLFTKFGRGNASSLNGGGSGLGLYLAHEIVKAHHGHIEIISEGVGKGSMFRITLPRS